MGSTNYIKIFCTVLCFQLARQHWKIFILRTRDSNPYQLAVESKRYICAMPTLLPTQIASGLRFPNLIHGMRSCKTA